MHKKYIFLALLLNICIKTSFGMKTDPEELKLKLARACSINPFIPERKQLNEERVYKLSKAGVPANEVKVPGYSAIKEILETHATYTSFICVEQKQSELNSERLARYMAKRDMSERILRFLLNAPNTDVNVLWMDIHPLKLYTNKWGDSSKSIDPAIVELLATHKSLDQNLESKYSISDEVIQDIINDEHTIPAAIPALKKALEQRK